MTASSNATSKILELRDNKLVEVFKLNHGQPICGSKLSPDEKWVAIAMSNSTLKVMNLRDILP